MVLVVSGSPTLRPRIELHSRRLLLDVDTDAGAAFRWEISPDGSEHVPIIIVALEDFIIVHAHIDLGSSLRFDGCQDGIRVGS
jgi:hypothetical protein